MFESVKYFLIDIDGTVCLDSNIIDGTVEFLDAVKKSGRDYCFLTNNSSTCDEDSAKRLSKMGINVSESKIINSADITADYINKNYKNKSVFLVGNEKLANTFEKSGITLVNDNPDIVVVGLDNTLTYDKVYKAANYIINGAIYLATHPDKNCPTANGVMPDAGSIIELFYASTNKKPQVLGKPYTPTVDYVTNYLNCTRNELAFVGDRLEADIATGFNHGLTSVLVYSGITNLEMYRKSPIRATVAVDRLYSLIKYL